MAYDPLQNTGVLRAAGLLSGPAGFGIGADNMPYYQGNMLNPYKWTETQQGRDMASEYRARTYGQNYGYGGSNRPVTARNTPTDLSRLPQWTPGVSDAPPTSAERQSRINTRVVANKARSARAKETGAVAMQGYQDAMRANPGMQQFEQDNYWSAMRETAPLAMKMGGSAYGTDAFRAAAQFGPSRGAGYAEAQSQINAPGGPAQWGWDGGRGTYQPLNQSAMNASFGPRAAPSAEFQRNQAATQRAYDMPAQQSARTRQMIYGYGGF